MSQAIDDRLQQIKSDFGDHLTKQELAFLQEIQLFFDATLKQQRGFGLVVEIVASKLQSYRKNQSPHTRARASFFVDVFQRTFDDDMVKLETADLPLTEKEAGFAKDVIEAIDFVIRNGIGFGLIAAALSHDLREIMQEGSIDNATFNPMVSGWADYNRLQIAPTEPEEI
jgi:hypothetical protein